MPPPYVNSVTTRDSISQGIPQPLSQFQPYYEGDFFLLQLKILLLVFRRRDLCEARPQTASVFEFSDVVLALKSDRHPPVEASGGQEQY